MNWKKPQQNIFFVPIPANGQNLYNLTEYRRNPEAPKQTYTLVDTETQETYQTEILDYLGPFEAEHISDIFARLVTDNKNITGKTLFKLLQKRSTDFKNVEKILFYQLSVI